ncbi:MAG: hydroxymethylbilane synthase [Magnetococcales bacterium]|nr:hydroxymethylbilane synthase [Magnetococcales bacterium]MBF0148875.1 hydroxymethylbilane synthase [Magnetococcales bacterium]
MAKKNVNIGTRSSALALWQARWVKSKIESLHDAVTVELIPIKTRGDKILDVPLAKVGGKGLFVKELEDALLDGRCDLAVHSMKDVPVDFPEGLMLGPILPREDPRDALLSVAYSGLHDLPHGARVGSSSLRRQSQLLAIRPDLRILSLRGNVNTRIDKLLAGQFDAIVLAAAGVKRLEATQHVVEYLDIQKMLPANGQGAVGIELRCADPEIQALVQPLDDLATRHCVLAERAFLKTLEGGCQTPIAGHATLNGDLLHLRGRVASLDGGICYEEVIEGAARQAEDLGVALAQRLLASGADRLLADLLRAAHEHP